MSSHVYVRAKGHTINAGFTRPADTATYGLGEVISNSTSAPVIMTFNQVTLGKGEASIIAQAELISSSAPTLKLVSELWLFDTTVTMDNDNAAFTPSDAELLTLVGIIPFTAVNTYVGDATADAGGNVCYLAPGLSIPVNTLITDNAIYGVLVARNAYVPVNAETFKIRLHLLD